MFSPRISLLLTCVSLVAALAMGIDWIVAEWLGIGSSQARWWLLTANLGLLVTGLACLLDRERTLRRTVVAQLDALAHQDIHRLAANLPMIDSTGSAPHSEPAVRLHERLVSLSRQVTELERERTDLQSRASRHESQSRRVRSVLSALAEPVLVIDKRDELVMTNSSADRLLALDPQSTQQRAIESLVRCEQLVELMTETRKRKALTQQCREIEMIDGEGTPRWYRVTARNMPTRPDDSDPDGSSQGAVALLQDISAQRRLQKRNAEFVSAVSHEMKTPLAGIRAYIELLADGEADNEASRQEFLSVINAEATRLQCLIDDLVELARIEADVAGTRRNEQPLKPILDDAVAAVRKESNDKRIELLTDLADGGLAEVDQPMLLLAVVHLLANAIKYTPAGGRVVLRSSRQGSAVCIEVEDSGVGLSAEDCQRVFEKFYRVPGHRGLASGAGLGLPLVKHIVEDVHGGTIDVESKPGQGSRFRIWLPIVAPA